jgi:ubiquinone biosynthesis monooxygenase Coq7
MAPAAELELTDTERREAAALMRVNHVGEVCAQALYTGQALASQDPALRAQLAEASREETDHLAWTQQRLKDLKDRPSLLNPLWYAGAFAIGYAAGKLGGDKVSLGFVVETERQVEAHLQSHMDRLPAADSASRAIVAQMKADEMAHAQMAMKAGAVELPGPVKSLMQLASKVMTTVAHRV